MQRLSNGTQVTAMPVPSASSGTPGFATEGNPATSQQASIWDADQYNRIQEELAGTIEGAGLELDGSDLGQLLKAILALSTYRNIWVRTLQGSYTWTVPAGVTRIRVRLCAGGGGGGRCTDVSGGGAGGGAGGYAEAVLTVVPGTTYAITVGQGGNAGGASGAIIDGQPGTTTSFGTLLTATGGAGGIGQTDAVTFTGGGLGGLGAGGDLSIAGGNGTDGMAGSLVFSGNGGASYFGGGGRGATTGFSDWQIARCPGSGGGGAYAVNGAGGGHGADGCCIIEY